MDIFIYLILSLWLMPVPLIPIFILEFAISNAFKERSWDELLITRDTAYIIMTWLLMSFIPLTNWKLLRVIIRTLDEFRI